MKKNRIIIFIGLLFVFLLCLSGYNPIASGYVAERQEPSFTGEIKFENGKIWGEVNPKESGLYTLIIHYANGEPLGICSFEFENKTNFECVVPNETTNFFLFVVGYDIHIRGGIEYEDSFIIHH